MNKWTPFCGERRKFCQQRDLKGANERGLLRYSQTLWHRAPSINTGRQRASHQCWGTWGILICLDAMSLAHVCRGICASTSQLWTRGTTVTNHVLHWNNKQCYQGQTLLEGSFICLNLINSPFRMYGIKRDRFFFFTAALQCCTVVLLKSNPWKTYRFSSEFSKYYIISKALNGTVVLWRHNAARHYLYDSSLWFSYQHVQIETWQWP